MPSAPVKPYLSEGRVGRRLPFDLWVPVIALVAMIGVVLLSAALRSGPFVSSVTIDNTSNYAFEVSVAGSAHGSTTLLGNVEAKNHTTLHSVYDQGSTWTFRFSSQDRYAGQVVMSRADLEAANWQVAVPDQYGAALAHAGVPPTN